MALNKNDVYSSPANETLLSLLPDIFYGRVIDIGAGSGSNLKKIRNVYNVDYAVAVTCSAREGDELKQVADRVVVKDIESLDDHEWGSGGALGGEYDLVIASHVLEHCRDSDEMIHCMAKLVKANGYIVVGLPNLNFWKTRLDILLGRFRYSNGGIFDKSHLRFFSYQSAVELVKGVDSLLIERVAVSGSIPLGAARKFFPKSIMASLTRHASRGWPGLISYEVFILARRKSFDYRCDVKY